MSATMRRSRPLVVLFFDRPGKLVWVTTVGSAKFAVSRAASRMSERN